jgi:hypothetical protein
MIKYILKSTGFEGQITFGFNVEGRLIFFNNEGEMTAEQHDWLLTYLPIHISRLDQFKKRDTITIIEIPDDITWDRFWNTYDLKLNAKRCKPLWEALNDHDKLLAIIRISHYKTYSKAKGTAMCNPERYLRDRYFDTDFLRLNAK